MFRSIYLILLSLLVTISFSACSTTRINPLLSQVPDASYSRKDIQSLEKRALLLWEKRQEPSKLAEFINTQLQVASSVHATETEMTLLARAYYFSADSHEQNDSEKLSLLSKGANWAEKALTTRAEFKQKVIDEKIPTELALQFLIKGDIEPLYWFALCLGQWARLSGLNTMLKYKDRVKRMMDRVAELDPHIFHGGVYRFYAVYFAVAPGLDQKGLEQSENYFKKAFKAAPDYFSAHVLYAETLAVKKGDSEAFKKHLNLVLKGNPEKIKDFYPEQILEQTKAKRLLARMGELF